MKLWSTEKECPFPFSTNKNTRRIRGIKRMKFNLGAFPALGRFIILGNYLPESFLEALGMSEYIIMDEGIL